MFNSYLFQHEPHWRNVTTWRQQNISPELKSWLWECTSLTQRLRDEWQAVSVQILHETLQTPFLTESRILGQPQQHYALVREVVLKSHQIPLIVARTVIPLSTLKRKQGINLAHLGTRPLGEILFSDQSLERQLLGITKIDVNSWHNRLRDTILITTPLWGRRIEYKIDSQPLLVSEFFLPSLFKN